MDEDVERRTAFECERTGVVDVYGKKNCGEPKSDAPARVDPEKAEERDLPGYDLPAQKAELFIGSAGAEQVRAFTGIEAVTFGVDNIVDAVKKKTEREDNVEKANPKGGGVEIENTTEGHKVEEDCG